MKFNLFKSYFATLVIILGASSINASESKGGIAQEPIFGKWLVQDGDAIINIQPCRSNNNTICGKISWLREPNNPNGSIKTDLNNPDPQLRNRPVIGSEIITNFRQTRRNEWTNGQLYNGRNGRTYTGSIKLDGNSLILSGCALRVFCVSQTWRRVN